MVGSTSIKIVLHCDNLRLPKVAQIFLTSNCQICCCRCAVNVVAIVVVLAVVVVDVVCNPTYSFCCQGQSLSPSEQKSLNKRKKLTVEQSRETMRTSR